MSINVLIDSSKTIQMISRVKLILEYNKQVALLATLQGESLWSLLNKSATRKVFRAYLGNLLAEYLLACKVNRYVFRTLSRQRC